MADRGPDGLVTVFLVALEAELTIGHKVVGAISVTGLSSSSRRIRIVIGIGFR
jgi:hypothetical protein